MFLGVRILWGPLGPAGADGADGQDALTGLRVHNATFNGWSC